MSVWDDSWGACDARGVRGDRGTMVGAKEGPDASDARPLGPPDPLRQRRWPVLTIVAPADPRESTRPIVTDSSPTGGEPWR